MSTWGYEVYPLGPDEHRRACGSTGTCTTSASLHVLYVAEGRTVGEKWLCAAHAPVTGRLYEEGCAA